MTSRGVLVCLATLATLCVVMDGPLMARLLPWLTGQCSPALGPVSRWNEGWGIGWLRFHNRLVREVTEADKGQVSGFHRGLINDPLYLMQPCTTQSATS